MIFKNYPFGLKPYQDSNLGIKCFSMPVRGEGDIYPIFNGDPVKIEKLNNIPTGNLAPLLAADYAADNDVTFLGVFLWCEYTTSDGKFVKQNYWPGSRAVQLKNDSINVYLETDPNALYIVQCSSSRARSDRGAGNFAGLANKLYGYLFFGISNYGALGAGINVDDIDESYSYEDGSSVKMNQLIGNYATGSSAVYADVGGSSVYSGQSGSCVMPAPGVNPHMKVVGFFSPGGISDVPLYATKGMYDIDAPGKVISRGSFNQIIVKLNNML